MHRVYLDDLYNTITDMGSIKSELYDNHVITEDVGIGHYEFWGKTGFNSQIETYMDQSGTVEIYLHFPEELTPDGMTQSLKVWVEEEFELFKANGHEWRAVPENIRILGSQAATFTVVWESA